MPQVRPRTLLTGAVAVALVTASITSGHGSHAVAGHGFTDLHDVLLAADAYSQDNKYLQVTGFTGGESTDKYHQGMADIDSIKIGLSNTVATSSTGATTAGKPHLDPVVITKSFDAYTPQFFKAAGLGTHLSNVKVYIQYPGENEHDFATIGLTNAVVTHDVIDAEGNEVVTLAVIQECVSYEPEKADGTFGTAVKTCFNGATRKVS